MMFAPIALVAALVQGGNPEVTVYNQGFGFIKELRTFNLRPGRQTVAVEDVAAMIETNSVGVRSITDVNAFQVLEQNYQYDLISVQAILNKAVGQQIRFHRVLPNGAKEILVGTLVSSPTAIVSDANGNQNQTYNGMVIKTDDGRIVLNPSGEIEVTSLPEGLISKPTLLWDLQVAKGGENTVELSYLTQGMNWKSDYVFTLDGTSKADLLGWVTLTNNSGATFKDAKLKLLAGDVERAQQFNRPGSFARGGGAMEMKSADAFKEESLFEYHLYTLQRPATVKNREIKQVSLLEGHGIVYTKKLIVDALMDNWRFYPSEGEIGLGDIKPQVRVEFENSEKNDLGIPLPAGTVKVYQRDKSGSVQMLGEDRIDHTPKNEKISLVVGKSFDVRATRKRKNYRRINDRTFEQTFEVEVRNRKDTAETVHVLERMWGDWKITQKNTDFEKLDANTAQWVVVLKPNEVKTVTYTVVTTW